MKLKELFDLYRIDYRTEGQHHNVRPGWIAVGCPFCGPGFDKFHLGFNLAGWYASCWQCGPKQIGYALDQILPISRDEIENLLRNVSRTRSIKTAAKAGRLTLPKNVQPLQKPHRQYLEKRGFDPDELIRLWWLGGIGLDSRLSWRLFIPIYQQGQVVSWTTRSISDDHPRRYVAAKPEQEAMPHRSILYGEDYCTEHAVIVHEGPTDVWRTGPGAVATFGLGYSREQVERLSKYQLRVIAFDREQPAQERAHRLADDLSAYAGETMVVMMAALDPGSAKPAETKRLRDIAGIGVYYQFMV